MSDNSRRFFLISVITACGTVLSSWVSAAFGAHRHFVPLFDEPSEDTKIQLAACTRDHHQCRANLSSETCRNHSGACEGRHLTCSDFSGACRQGRVTCRDHAAVGCRRRGEHNQ
jgi:hypothetical protein